MDVGQIIVAVLVVFFSGLLQGTVAFGFALLSVPLLLMAGFTPPIVMTITSVCSAVQSGSGVHHLRESVPWKYVGASVAVRAVTMVLGIWVLHALVDRPVAGINFWIGLVLLVLVLLLASWRPVPKARLNGAWNLIAFGASGFTGGLCSMDGPPLVLWVMAHDWTVERTRAFLFAAFLCVVPIQMTLLYLVFGNCVLQGIAWGAALAPAGLLGSLIGLRVGSRFSKPLLRRLAYALLIVIAVSAMCPYVWRWLRAC